MASNDNNSIRQELALESAHSDILALSDPQWDKFYDDGHIIPIGQYLTIKFGIALQRWLGHPDLQVDKSRIEETAAVFDRFYERVDHDREGENGVFAGFRSVQGEDGIFRQFYLPSISFARQTAESHSAMLSTRIHEMVHALQLDVSAAMHASVANMASIPVLHPLEELNLRLLMEYDAFAREAGLTSIFAAQGHYLDLPCQRLVDLYDHAGVMTLDLPLSHRLMYTSQNIFTRVETDDGETLLDYYAIHIAKGLAATFYNVSRAGLPTQIVSLEGSDFWDIISHGVGPNLLSEDRSFAPEVSFPLPKAARDIIIKLCDDLDLKAPDAYPSLRETLRRLGTSRLEFLNASRMNTMKSSPAYTGQTQDGWSMNVTL